MFSFYNCKIYYCYVLALMILVLILMLNDLGMSSICPCWILYICFDFFHCACLRKTTTNIRYSTHLWDAEVKRFAFGGFLLDDFVVFSAPSTHAVLSKVEWKECYFRNDSIQMYQTFIQIIKPNNYKKRKEWDDKARLEVRNTCSIGAWPNSLDWRPPWYWTVFPLLQTYKL